MVSVSSLLDSLRLLLPPKQLAEAERLAASIPSAERLAQALAGRGLLTAYQADELIQNRGATLAVGAYLLLRKLGEGGMGEVFEARHRVMKRDVALKRIRPARLDSPDAVARFLREVQAAAKLSHPNVVQVFDAGKAGGCHYLAMELLAGEDLAAYLARKGVLPPAEAVEYVRQACAGMQHAHDKGLVHRDLKPANLMLCRGPMVKVMDLGLALVTDASTMTEGGGTFGTVDYIAPEQVSDSHKVDARADVYSLGCTLYHLLTGKTPFHEAHPAARPSMHVSMQPVALEQRRPDVPARLAAVVRKMMAKRREERYQSAEEASEALAALPRTRSQAQPGPVEVQQARPAPTKPLPAERPATTKDLPAEPKPLPKPRRKGPGGAVAGVLLVLLTLGVLGAVVAVPLLKGRKEPPDVVTKDDTKPPVPPKTDKDKPPPKTDKDKTPVPPPPPPPPKDRDKAAPKLPPLFLNAVGMRLTRVKAGTFTMGSPEGEKERLESEGPQHTVEITRDFWMGVYEVTQGQYRTVMGHNPSHFSHDGTKSAKGTYGKTNQPGEGTARVKAFTQQQLDDFPVECVSWDDAQEFVVKLNERAAKERPRFRYRLPTEAEWEYACRASSAYKVFAFGDGLSSKQANISSLSPYGDAEKGPYLGRPQKVGSYAPNAWGLYDMHGNVLEWCQDRYGNDYYKNAPRRDPAGPATGTGRVIRGGGWLLAPRFCRSASRSQWTMPSYRSYHVGFRVVAEPAE